MAPRRHKYTPHALKWKILQRKWIDRRQRRERCKEIADIFLPVEPSMVLRLPLPLLLLPVHLSAVCQRIIGIHIKCYIYIHFVTDRTVTWLKREKMPKEGRRRQRINVTHRPRKRRRPTHDENYFWIISISAILRINRFSTHLRNTVARVQLGTVHAGHWLVSADEWNVHRFYIELYLSSIKRLLRKLDDQWCARMKDDEWKIKITARSHSDSLGNISKLDASTIFRELKNLLHWPHSVTVAYHIYSHFLFLFFRAADTFTSAHIRMGHVVTRKFHPHYYRIYFISFASSYLASHRLLFRLSGKSVANSFFSRIVHRLFVSADWSSFRLKPFSHFVVGMLLINRANSASSNAVQTGVNNLANHFTWEICIVTLSSPPCTLFTRNTQMCEGSGDGSEMNIENKNAYTPLPSMSRCKRRPRPWYSWGNNLEPQCSQN